MDTQRDFYTSFLGLAVEWQPDPDSVYLTSGQDNIALHRHDEVARGGALDHIGFMVTTEMAVDRWFARAEEFGVKVLQAPKKHRDGARSCYLADPEGNCIQIIYHPPLAGLPAGTSPLNEAKT